MSETLDIVDLPHNKYAPDLRDYQELKAEKKRLDAESRKCEGMIKTLRSVIFRALDGAPAGCCGEVLITVKPEKVNPGCLTLKDGRKIMLDSISDIVFNNGNGEDAVHVSDVKTWFGGSVVGADLELTDIRENV